MRIKMTSVFVDNPNKALNFYTEILGFKTLMHMPEYNLAIVVSPEDENGTSLLLEPNQNPIAKKYHEDIYKENLPVIVFGSKNVQKEFEELSKKGVKFTQEPITNEWGITAIFDDTFGNLIQIHQDD
ncbi:MAG: VOC family protein [Draconibacterium sp.]|nr:VOC family protein [Draconibacterium sp.]